MTENKRFNLAFYDNYDGTFSIQDTLYLKENKHLHSLDEIIDLLNEQHEDILFKIKLIDSLQDSIGELKDEKNSLYNENEQLKQQDNINEDCYKTLLQKYDDLKKENEQLKQTIRTLGDFRNFITEQNVSNEKQRKELQLQMLRLYNYFENWFEDAMGSTAFSEMWDNVKEDKKWEKR